jgi:hypothetical protein
MIPVQVALVDESDIFTMQDLATIAGALNEQLQDDFRSAWPETPKATVGAYPEEPPDTWSIILRRDIGEPGALGYHTDVDGQPYSIVDADAGNPTVTISHELLEMIVDPFGMRMHGARLPDGLEDRHAEFGLPRPNTHVLYLLEVADPPEAVSYEVGGVQVSDFIHRYWYRTNPPARPSYSHTGAITRPRQIIRGGYVSFMVPQTRVWYQAFDWGSGLEVAELGRFDLARYGNLRAFADRHAITTKLENGR